MSNYYKLDIRLTPHTTDAADLLAAFLADIGFESFEESEDGMKAYIQEADYKEDALRETVADFPMGVKIEWEKELIEQRDWNEEWEKKYFKPLELGGGKCVVHATFHKEYPKAEYEIIIDPKMAFGTGNHATTTMMVNHLIDLGVKGKRVLDMGSGTGILAIIADKLGAESVRGIEIDPMACENARENVLLNDSKVEITEGDARSLEGIKNIDVFLANINRNIILADLEAYVSTLSKDGVMVLSGFYIQDVKMIEASLSLNGLEVKRISEEGEGWASIVAGRQP